MKIKLEISCCLCREKYMQEINLPDGWGMRYDEIDEENGFCKSHLKVKEWSESCCSGCVGGWMDCSLWARINKKESLDQNFFDIIKSGKCPSRTNGTFGFSSHGVTEIDLSEKATTESGKVFAKAIQNYRKIYEKYLH